MARLYQVAACIAALIPTVAFAEADPPPIQSWATRGMAAALESDSSVGTTNEALRFPYAVDIIAAFDVIDRPKIVDRLQAIISDNKRPGDAIVPAAEALARISPNRIELSVNALLDRLHDQDSSVAAAAAGALGRLPLGSQSSALVEALIAATEESNYMLQRASTKALGNVPPGVDGDAIAKTLVSRLSDGDLEVRDAAIAALGQIPLGSKRDAVIEALVKQVESGTLDNIAGAAALLGRVASADQVDALAVNLIQKLSDNDWAVREKGATALGFISGSSHTEAIVKALLDVMSDDKFAGVRDAAAGSLGKVQPGDQKDAVVKALVARLQDTEPSVRIAAATSLGESAPSQVDIAFKELLDQLNNADSSSFVRVSAATALGNLPAGSYQAMLVKALLDRLTDGDLAVRQAAAKSLGKTSLGDQTDVVVRALIPELAHEEMISAVAPSLDRISDHGRAVSEAALDALSITFYDNDAEDVLARLLLAGAQPIASQAFLLNNLSHSEFLDRIAPEARFGDHQRAFFYLISAGTPTAILINWLGHPHSELSSPDDAGAAAPILNAMDLLWPSTADQMLVREEIGRNAVVIVSAVCREAAPSGVATWMTLVPQAWRGLVGLIDGGGPAHCEQAEFLKAAARLQRDLGEARFREADDIADILAADARANPVVTWVARIVFTGFGYLLLWSAVMLTFPHSRFVQSVVFFSPRIRKLSSLYLSEVFPLIPFARRRLLSPFHRELGPKPELIEFATGDKWFSDVYVVEGGSSDPVLISRALPTIRGLTVLEGASGLGKTIYLVRLALDPQRLVAFIQAAEESGDVEQAIASRLPLGVMRDKDFLGSLIYGGGLDICIDGLNEVSAEARLSVVSFAKRMTKANILIATQPFRWDMPHAARVLRLQPLRQDQVSDFLEGRYKTLPATPDFIPLDEYRSRVHDFLVKFGGSDGDEFDSRHRALSNPMDLTTVASIVAHGGKPDLLNLQETAFNQAATTYRAQNQNAAFPLSSFAEYIYQERAHTTGRAKDLMVLDSPTFLRECQVLADHRLLLAHEEKDAQGQLHQVWGFRHDKILDFFLYVALTDESRNAEIRVQRLTYHIGDPRFRGVFLLMALRMPLTDAVWLRDRIADYAAEKMDSALSLQIWSTVRQRLDADMTNTDAESGGVVGQGQEATDRTG